VDHVKDYVEKKKLKTLLFSFIKSHINIVEFEKFIKNKGPDLNCRDDEWMTPLHVATKMNMSTAWINILIRHGADINRLTPKNKSPLHFACENNNVSVAALLLKFKANSKIVDNDKNTPMHIAIKHNNKELVNLLLSKTRDLQYKGKVSRPSRSVDIFKKVSSSRKRSLKTDHSNTGRKSPQVPLSSTKKFLQYKYNSNLLSKTQEKNSNNTVSSTFNTKLPLEKANSKTSHKDPRSKKELVTKNKFKELYKSTRLGKAQLHKNKHVSKTMNNNTIPYYKQPVSIKTHSYAYDSSPLGNNSQCTFENHPSQSHKTSPLAKTSQNYEVSIFNTNSDSSSIHKPTPDLLKYPLIDIISSLYLKNNGGGKGSKHAPEVELRKQEGWMYQGGMVEMEDEKMDQEFTEFVDAEEIMEVHERGEKAQSDASLEEAK
jgi:ankyrin repeat protein